MSFEGNTSQNISSNNTKNKNKFSKQLRQQKFYEESYASIISNKNYEKFIQNEFLNRMHCHQSNSRKTNLLSKIGNYCKADPMYSIRLTCKVFLEEILDTIIKLEQILIEDHQEHFRIKKAFQREVDKVHVLNSSLECEKHRNRKLVELIYNIDYVTSTDNDSEKARSNNGSRIAIFPEFEKMSRWYSKTSEEVFESLSPLLMQQRYDELMTCYKHSQRQLAQREKILTVTKCAMEEVQAKRDHLINEYRSVQSRFEDICHKYLRLQLKKKQETQNLRDALTYACDCILSAQNIVQFSKGRYKYHDKQFKQNLQLFIQSLKLCDQIQHISFL